MCDDRRLSVLGALKACAQREREGMAQFLESLGEFDACEWYSFEACSSSFAFLTERLDVSPGSAWKRLVVARAARRFPVILSLLREGKVHLTGLSLVARMLDESNVDFLLGAITGKTTRQIEELVADLKAQASGGSEGGKSTSLKGSAATVTPLGLGNWKVEFVADAELKSLMDTAMELCPVGVDLPSIVRMALEVFVQRKATRKFGAPRQQTTGAPSSEDESASGVDGAGERSRYISASTRRAVYERDGGQCAFVDDQGRRCSGRRGLQFDHVKPFCLGGGHDAGNIRLLCATHNRHEAREALGDRFMGRWFRSDMARPLFHLEQALRMDASSKVRTPEPLLRSSFNR